MKKSLLALTGLFIIATSVVSCKRHNGCNWSEEGTIRDYSNPTDIEHDTCGIVIELEDKTKLEPTNLASFPDLEYNDGDLVWVSYKETDGASTCGIGKIVKLRCIVHRNF